MSPLLQKYKKTFIGFGSRERLFDRMRTLIVTWVYFRGKMIINMGGHAQDSVDYGIVRRPVLGSYPSLGVVGVSHPMVVA